MESSTDTITATETSNTTTSLETSVSISLLVFGVPIGVALITLNCLLFVVIYKKREEGPFRKSTTCLLVSLGVCDMLAGVVLLVHVVLLALPESVFIGSSVYLCKFWGLLQTTPMIGDIIHLVAISGERNQTISHPARQPKAETMKLVAVGVWGLTLALSALAFAFPVPQPNSGYCDIADLSFLYFIIVVFLVVMLGSVIVCVYYLYNIKGTLKVHQRKIQVTNTITYDNLLDDTAAAKLFFIIYSLTILIWLPLVITLIVSFTKGGGLDSAVRFVFLFGHIAYFKVPMIIYGSKDFRLKFIGTFKRKPQSFVSPR